MWTWQFQLDDILTTLSIVAIIGGASYRLLILPILTRISEERMQDNLLFTERMNKLNETLVDLKDEIKLSREQRTKEYAEQLSYRLVLMHLIIGLMILRRNFMSIPPNLINTVKKSYQSVRVANFHPTGVLATRALVFIMLVPILLVVVEYIMMFIQGNVSDDMNKLINVGINIIDHIFIPSVLTALVGFLALWIDKDGDGIPDKLEEPPKLPPLPNVTERSDRNDIDKP